MKLTMKEKALDLLRYFVERQYEDTAALPPAKGVKAPASADDTSWERTEELLAIMTVARARTKPDYVLGTAEEFAEYEAQLRLDMAKELREMRQPVTRVITKDGIDLSYRTSMGVLELRRLANHVACRRVVLCVKCCRKADESDEKRPLACRCPSALQRWVWRMLKQVERQPYAYRWAIAYVALVLRDVIQHWKDNRIGLEDPKKSGAKLHKEIERERELELCRPDEVIEEYDDEDKLVRRITVSPNDGTSRLALDLRGWDRPSSMGRRTQRLAFCPECAVIDNPWFLVARKMPFGEATCNHTVNGSVCGTTEVEPPPRSGRIHTYQVVRHRRAHGKVEKVVHEFYRNRGRWCWSSTNEQVHLALSHQLERRWLAKVLQNRSA